jgi:hypothetical protein
MRTFLLPASLLLVLVATSDARRRSFGVSQSSSHGKVDNGKVDSGKVDNGKVDRAKLVSIRKIRKIKDDQKSRTAEQVFSSSGAPERFSGF